MAFCLSTERLLLRPFQMEDAAGFYALNAQPEVLRYTGDKPFANIQAARDFIASYDHYQRYGYGRWAIILRSTQQFIGFCGLKYHPNTKDTDLGYRINQQEWGRGLATEAARSCLSYGLSELGLERIIGRVRADNLASIRVLEKIGMQLQGNLDFDGYPGFLYALEAANR